MFFVAGLRKASWWKVVVAAILAIGVPIGWASLGAVWLPRFGDSLLALGPWAVIGFTLLGAVLVMMCGPASLLYITGGMVFGAAWGTLWGAIAGVVGSTAAFLIARSALGRHVARALSKSARLDRFERALSERGLWLTLLLRLSLLFPIGPVSYALGLSRIPLRYFLWTSAALLPSVFTYSYAGSVARDLVSAQARPREPWEWVVVCLGVLATAAAAFLVGRAATHALRKRKPQVTLPGASGLDHHRLLPPRATDAEGKPRSVGVEVEFAVLDLDSACRTIERLFGGHTDQLTEVERRVRDTRLGEFTVELDSHALKTLAHKRRRGMPLRWIEKLKGGVLWAAADTFTPNELSTAPIAFEQLPELDRLVHALGRAGAKGTDDSLLNVLGVHFNPSVPSVEPRVLRDYIRAYALLHDELVEALNVDPSRRVMGFATAYPRAYARLVLDRRYDPDLTQLIDDYLQHNPTRNRALDLMPLLAYLDRERVQRASADPRVGARPTFHFRLPNSEIGNPAWRITDQWALWLEVEKLASDPARLAALSGEALRRFELPWPKLRRKWGVLGRSTPDSR